MKKSLLGKIAIVIILLIAFIGYTVYSNWQNSHFTVDPEAFTIKNSFQGVLDDEYKEFPGLKLADYYGLTKNIDKTIQIPELHRQIKIHKVWALPYSYYLLYSINLKKTDKSPDDIPKLKFSNISYHIASGKSSTAKVDQKAKVVPEGVFQHRLYRGVIIHPDFQSLNSSNFLSEKSINTLDKISLKNAKLVWKNGTANKNNKPLDDLSVSTHFDRKKDITYFTIPVHQKLKLDNGETLILQRLKAYYFGNQLIFTMKPGNQFINRLNVDVSGQIFKNAPPHFGASVHRKDGLYYLSLPRFTDVPKQLTLKIKGMSTITNNSLHFQIPGWDGKKKESSNEKIEVAEFMGSPFYFEGYSNNLYGPSVPTRIALKLNWKIPEQIKDFSFFNLIPAKEFKNQSLENIHIPGIVTIKNDNGKQPDFIRQGGSAINDDQSKTLTLILNKKYVKNTDHLSITINHLPNYEKINAKEVKIKIPNAGRASE